MGDFNKLFALIFGIIIFIILLVFLAKRLNFVEKIPIFSSTSEKSNVKQVDSPTPTPYETVIVTNINQKKEDESNNNSSVNAARRVKGVSSYPETGPEDMFLFFSLASIFSGYLIRRKA